MTMVATSRSGRAGLALPPPRWHAHRECWSACWLALALFIVAVAAQAQNVQDGFDPQANGAIHDLVVLPDGRQLVAGAFTEIGGGPQAYLARLNHDGSLDTGFTPVIDQAVEVIALTSEGAIVAGGRFLQIDGQPRQRLARLSADGALDAGFEPTVNGSVMSLAIQADGAVVVGGQFTSVNGQNRRRLARVSASGQLDSFFNPTVPDIGGFIPSSVNTLVVQPDGYLLVGGVFIEIAGGPAQFLARLTAGGALDPGFSAMFDDAVLDLAVQDDGRILAGGSFSSINGVARRGLVRLLADGSVDADFAASAGFETGQRVDRVLLQPDGDIVIGGMFSAVAGEPRLNLARFDHAGELDSRFANGTGSVGSVRALAAQADGNVLVGGNFDSLAGHPRGHLGRLYPGGGADATLPALGIVGDIKTAVTDLDGNLVIAGKFTEVAGQPRSGLARLRADGSLDPDFAPTIVSRSYGVPVIVLLDDGSMLVGGSLISVNGEPRTGVARLFADGSLDPDFVPDIVAESVLGVQVVSVLRQPDGRLLVAGSFNLVEGEPHWNVVRLQADGRLDDSFAAKTNGSVQSMRLLPDGRVLLGGLFSGVNDLPHIHVARLHPDGSIDSGFQSAIDAAMFTGVSAVYPQADGKVLANGIFYSAAGLPRNGLVRLNHDGSLDAGFDPGFSGPVDAITELADGRLLLAGNMASAGGQHIGPLARLLPDGSIDPSFRRPAFNSRLRAIGVQADGKLLAIGPYVETVDGHPRTGLARIGATAASLPTLSLDGATAIWRQQGEGPAPAAPVRLFYADADTGEAFTELGTMQPGAGEWRLSGLDLPDDGSFRLRAVAVQATGGYGSTSSGLYGTTRRFLRSSAPALVSVTPSAGTGGRVFPADVQTIQAGSTIRFRVVVDAGWWLADVAGSCAGTLVDDIYTVSEVAQDCTVEATFTDQAPLPPTIDIVPGSLSFEVKLGGADEAALTIANPGDARLDFLIDSALPNGLGGYLPAPVRAGAIADGQFLRASAGTARGPDHVGARDAVELTQMQDNAPVAGNGVVCTSSSGSGSPTSWWRRFYFPEHPGVGASTAVNAVTIASESGPSVPVTILAYTLPAGVPVDTIPVEQLELIGTGSGTAGGARGHSTIAMDAVVDDTAGKDLVIEYRIDAVAGQLFLPGGNATPETHPTFISAPSCGVPTPATATSINYPDFHLVMIVEVDDPVGCQVPTTIPWLSLDRNNGEVDPGDSVDVQVGVDSAGLSTGLHESQLCVASNDPTRSLVAVPVLLQVVDDGDRIFRHGFE